MLSLTVAFDVRSSALLDVSASTVRKHLAGHEPLREFTGSVDVYTYGNETVEELKANPEIISLQTAPVAPEGVITISHFAKPRKVSPDRVRELSRKYHMPIGTYRFGDRVGEGYTPHDLNYLAALLDEEASRYHVIGTDEFSMNVAANELSMSSGVTILKVATLLSENDPVFGEIVYRRVSKSIAPVLNKAQLEIVGNYIKEHGLRRGPRNKN
ncbi:MAG: hypothetical protein WAW63_01045 [Candidatus Saccharimonadales bacterium]|nr:hypothetical protein [Candidatus Saccharibacteria bacterium]